MNKIIILFTFVLIIVLGNTKQGYAQLEELQVTKLEAPSTVAVFVDYPNEAAIIIRSSLTNLVFDSNVGIIENKSNSNAGEYRLIIQPFRQTISVQAEGFIQLRFNIIPSGARDVIYYEVQPKVPELEAIPINIIVQKNGEVASDGIDIFIDDQLAESKGNTYSVAPGNHLVRIEGGLGYKIISDEINVDVGNTFFPYNLEQLELVQFSLTTNPSNASIFINNETPRTTPFGDFRFPGEYFVQILLDGYERLEQTIIVKENEENSFNFDLEPSSTRLILDIDPPDANIQLNRIEYNGQSDIPLTPGLYRLEITKKGYDTYTEQFQIAKDQEIRRTVSMNQLKGMLEFSVFPLEANVSLKNLNGELIKNWNGLLRNNFPIGNYTLEATLVNHDTVSVDLEIGTDSVSNVQIELLQTQGLGSIEIIGLEGTNASLLGGKSFNYINFPGIINIPSIQYGTYTLRAKKQGFMVINEEIEFRDTYMSIDLFDYYQPKSKKSAISRSLLIPGGGQLYLDRKRGFLYLFGEAMFLGLSVYYHQEYKNREQDYGIALQTYRNATTDFEPLYQEVLRNLDKQNLASDTRNLMIIGFLGLKGLEFIDLLIFTENPRDELKRAKQAQFKTTQDGIGIRYNF